jgi:DNA helicase-2/ATP-dependent DNA helicase PcrA
MSSRFIDELPSENIKKNNHFIEDEVEDFEFNQDVESENEIKSPGWLRYQKKIKR